jgi:hypothetical protein
MSTLDSRPHLDGCRFPRLLRRRRLSRKGSTILWFISKSELRFITARIELDRRDVVVEPFHWGSYLKGALDLKVWGFPSLFGLTTVNTYAISHFLPLM